VMFDNKLIVTRGGFDLNFFNNIVLYEVFNPSIY
jgi:hypothetical protein